MKLLHTSDWHLGKKLFKVERLPEQQEFLWWLSDYIISNKIDVLLISGDIFDVPNPPSDALASYFKFLRTITQKSDCRVIVLSGNHDSGNFLEAPGPFLETQNIKIIGRLKKNLSEQELKEKYIKSINIGDETIHIIGLPYFRANEIMDIYPNKNIEHDEDLILFNLKKLLSQLTKNLEGRKILMGHHLFGSFQSAGSEQGLSLSGLESIPLSLFKDNFDYLALGHIHKPQKIKSENPLAVYSGSPIPMRFSENETKRVIKIQINDNELKTQSIDLPLFRNLLSVTVQMAEKNDSWKEQINQQLEQISEIKQKHSPLVELTLKMSSPLPGIIDQIREYFSEINMILVSTSIERAAIEKKEGSISLKSMNINYENIFIDYYNEKYPLTPLTNKLLSEFNELLEDGEDI